MRQWLFGGLFCDTLLAWNAKVNTQSGTGTGGEWPAYGGDKGFTKYSPLDQINRSNVGNLTIAWRRSAVADEVRTRFPDFRFSSSFESTPVMVGGVLYASDGLGLVEAFDPATGKTILTHELVEGGPRLRGSASRGVAYWRSGDEARILSVQGQYLVALDARTGKVIRAFGVNGQVDLKPGLGPRANGYSWSS